MEGRRARGEGRGGQLAPGYYGVPPIHKPHWKWLIISYFFLGGISAGSYVLAAIADLFGPRQDRSLVRAGRYLSLLALLPCPLLLILDLGRPTRFHHMLRVLKLRSPMSLGTWGLLAFGGFSTVSAASQLASDGLLGARGRPLPALPARGLAVVGAAFGMFVGGYPGVLLGATAVPFWARSARLLGPLFLSSALSASCAALELALALRPGQRRATLERLERAERVAALSELGALAATHLTAGRLATPLLRGRLGLVHVVGSIGAGIVLPAALRLAGPRLGLPERLLAVLASLLTLAGGFALKYAVVMAGRASADDPAATFAFARRSPPTKATSA